MSRHVIIEMGRKSIIYWGERFTITIGESFVNYLQCSITWVM
jgi:hypothetical protein